MAKASKSASPSKSAASPIRVGNPVFIRTVTHHYTGKIVGVTKDEILLVKAAWIASDGRFAQALASGVFDEVEPYPPALVVSIGRGAVIDVVTWGHALPSTVK